MVEPNFENRTLYHGDNLDFLRGINSGTVNLIATDPPFNKARDFHATPDSLAKGASFTDRWRWEEDVHEEWVDAIKDNWPGVWAVIEAARAAYGPDMAAFLCWLGVRLLEMHRILRPDGSLYLHIDHTAHAWVKCLLDAIFGKGNFRNEIVWCYSTGGASKKGFAKKHDTILRYSKGDNPIFNTMRQPYTSNMSKQESKQHLFNPDGKIMLDWWQDILAINPMAEERTGYPTQKPLALYERIIKASSNPGDIVLDPFCGCATTPVAAERLGRQWMGMDIWDGAHQMVLDRLAAEGLAVPDANAAPGQQTLTFDHISYATTPPVRTDANEIPVPDLRIRIIRPKEPWQRLTNREIRAVLEDAQAVDSLVGCAGCGRVLESEFMELDHITPKAERGEDHLLNRILLCRPCNGRKSNTLTMAGLRQRNNQEKWMKDRGRAEQAQQSAFLKASYIRDKGLTH